MKSFANIKTFLSGRFLLFPEIESRKMKMTIASVFVIIVYMEEEITPLEVKEEIEKAADFQGSWSKYLALTTAVIAVLSAIAALQSGNFADRALLEKNNAVLFQSKASDQWNYYQAKGVKKNVAEGFAGQTPDAKVKQQIDKYAQEQKAIQQQAQTFEEQVKNSSEKSDHLFEKHHTIAFGVTLFQIAVALSAMSALMRRKSLWYLSILSAIGGVSLLVYGILK
ncbi:MAG TPA: DUF4337 domain-containing protein [Patescibacteria group bacterium]